MTEAQLTKHCTKSFKEARRASRPQPEKFRQFIPKSGSYLRGKAYRLNGIRRG